MSCAQQGASNLYSVMDGEMRDCIRLTVLLATAAFPQMKGAAQTVREPRAIGKFEVSSQESFSSLASMRSLPHDQLLVHDLIGQRVVLLDSFFRILRVVADTSAQTQHALNERGGRLIAYRGDSSIIVDPVSSSAAVLDGTGRLVRTIALANPDDIAAIASPFMGTPAFGGGRQLIYRRAIQPRRPGDIGSATAQASPARDSAAIVRFDLDARRLDTIAFVVTYAPTPAIVRSGTRPGLLLRVNPMPSVDDWTVRPDGALAILQQNYRLRLMYPNGKQVLGPPLPFSWRKLDDSTKKAVVDSARREMRAAESEGRIRITFEGQLLVEPRRNARGPVGTDSVSQDPTPSETTTPSRLTFVEPAELPDFAPAFAAGAMLADKSNNIWVRTIQPRAVAGVVYDVINPVGQQIDRVLFPFGVAILGFGDGGAIYAGVRTGGDLHLARTHWKAP